MQERLQKILSARGIASRRKAEELIAAGMVKVNGEPAHVGQKADPLVDTIEVDGAAIEARKELLYFVLYKPVGVESTNYSTVGARTILDILPNNLKGVVFPVGRLDKESEGLLLLTNDGVLAYRLTHPGFDHEKEYEVHLSEEVTEGQLRKMRQGMTILGSRTKPALARKTAPNQFHIVLTEGKNRQIRRMCQKVGLHVERLIRIRIVTLRDATLKPGQMRPLTQKEWTELLESVGVPQSKNADASSGS